MNKWFDRGIVLLMAAATTFGGIVYKNAVDRIGVLEAHAQAEQRERSEILTSLVEIRTDVKYLRQALERTEHRLDIFRSPEFLLKSNPRIQGP